MKIIRAINKNKTKYKLKNLIKNKTKKTKPNKQSEFLDLSNIESGSFFKKKDKSVPEDTKSDLLVVEKGNIVYGKCRPNLDKAIIAEKDAVTTGESLVYETFCAEFVLSLMHSKNFINYNVRNALGAKMPRTSNKNVLNYEFVTLEDIDFEKTGNFLFENQLRIRNIQKLIEKLEKRNQYYAERLLSGELRVRKNEEGNIEFYENKEWKEAYVNGLKRKIPIDTQITTLRKNYLDINQKGKEGMENYLEIGDIDISTKLYDLSNKDKQSVSSCKIVPKNTLLISTVRPTRRCFTITQEETVVSNAFVRFNIGEDNYPLHIINTINFSTFCERYSEGGTYPVIKPYSVENYEYLNFPEKYIIASILNNLVNQKNKLSKLLEKEQKRFEWLSDALLSGEYQIVD